MILTDKLLEDHQETLRHQVSGVHVKAEKSAEPYFNKQFNIEHVFPRYALIDKNGKLITVPAPSPQDEATYELIRKYAEQ